MRLGSVRDFTMKTLVEDCKPNKPRAGTLSRIGYECVPGYVHEPMDSIGYATEIISLIPLRPSNISTKCPSGPGFQLIQYAQPELCALCFPNCDAQRLLCPSTLTPRIRYVILLTKNIIAW